MTEEIIIDGVDVSKCCWCKFEPEIEPYCTINDGEDLDCGSNSNCYFKQLKRKEQECEQLKSENFIFEELIKTQDGLIEQMKNDIERLKEQLNMERVYSTLERNDRLRAEQTLDEISSAVNNSCALNQSTCYLEYNCEGCSKHGNVETLEYIKALLDKVNKR